MSLAESRPQPIAEYHFPISFAMVGSTIPGVLRKYPVRIVNYADLSSVVIHRKAVSDPVIRYPSMGDKNSKGHPMMERLKQMLANHGQPQMREGYSRIKEDLSWRGQSAPRPPQNPAI